MKKFVFGFLLLACCATAGNMTDLDDDGLPDVWETAFGFRTNSTVGIDGPYGDMDQDGLNNLSEYRAGYYVIGADVYSNYTWAVAGLLPTNGYSAGALWGDRHVVPTNSLVTLGWLFTDSDFVGDSWEATNKNCSVRTWDNGTIVAGRTILDRYLNHITQKLPEATATVVYRGMYRQSAASVIVDFYTDSAMDGQPGATASFAAPVPWIGPATVPVTNFLFGALHTGVNYISAYLDLDGDKTWDAGEPFGLGHASSRGFNGALFGVAFGCGVNTFEIEMTDFTTGYLRFDLLSGRRTEDALPGVVHTQTVSGVAQSLARAVQTRVRVKRLSVDGDFNQSVVILDKMIRKPRTFIHEGDFFAQGDLTLDWGLDGVPGTMARTSADYAVFYGDDGQNTNFTNLFDVSYSLTRDKAIALSPVNGMHVYSAQPVFKWSMPDTYAAFTIEIKAGSSVGQTIFYSGDLPIPLVDTETGNFVWEAPIFANARLPDGMIFATNTVYAWRVIANNAKFVDNATQWSNWKNFRLSSGAAMQASSFGTVSVRAKYFGPATGLLANRVKVQAFPSISFAGYPIAEYTMSAVDIAEMLSPTSTVVNAVLQGLPSGKVFLRVLFDQNLNAMHDDWESWGYLMDPATFAPLTAQVELSGSAPVVYDIVVEDADSDQDRFPDSWEFELNPNDDSLHLTGPSTLTGSDAEINPELKLTP